jgi:death-on-curing protein
MTNQLFFIKKSLALKIHEQQVQRFGGRDGVRDEQQLGSALEAAQYAWHQTDDVYESAAKYCDSIISNHPFFDGNKRTAVACMLVFLIKNGIRLGMTNASLYDMVISTTNTIKRNELAYLLKKNTTIGTIDNNELPLKSFSNEWLKYHHIGMCSASYQEIYYKVAAEIILDGVVFQLQETKNKKYDSIFRFGRYVIYAGCDNYEYVVDSEKGRNKFALIAKFVLGNVSKTFEITELRVVKGETRPLILEKLSEYINSRYNNASGLTAENIVKYLEWNTENGKYEIDE